MMRGPMAVGDHHFHRVVGEADAALSCPRHGTRVTVTSAAAGGAAMTSAVKSRSSLSIMARIILAIAPCRSGVCVSH